MNFKKGSVILKMVQESNKKNRQDNLVKMTIFKLIIVKINILYYNNIN